MVLAYFGITALACLKNIANKKLRPVKCTLGIFLYLILREDFLSVVPKFLSVRGAYVDNIRVRLAENRPQKQVPERFREYIYQERSFLIR